MELYPTDFLLHILNVVVMFVLLRLILFKPVSRFLAARAEGIGSQLDDARKKLEEAEALKLEYDHRLDAAVEQGHDIIRDSQTKGALEARAIVADAQNQAEDILREAREKIEKERGHAVEQLRAEVAQLATDIAERILRREVTAEDNRELAEAFFREMKTP